MFPSIMLWIETIILQLANVYNGTFSIWYLHEMCYIVPTNFASALRLFWFYLCLGKILRGQQRYFPNLSCWVNYTKFISSSLRSSREQGHL